MKRKFTLLYPWRDITIHDRINLVDISAVSPLWNIGDILPDRQARSRMMSDIIILKVERHEVRHVAKKEKIKVPKWLCKHCWYDWFPRSENPPDRCANTKGYIDPNGKFHEKCGTRDWDQWPEGFDPKKCDSPAALSVYYDEQAEAAEKAQAELRIVNE